MAATTIETSFVVVDMGTPIASASRLDSNGCNADSWTLYWRGMERLHPPKLEATLPSIGAFAGDILVHHHSLSLSSSVCECVYNGSVGNAGW